MQLLISSVEWSEFGRQYWSRSARAMRLKTLHVHRATKKAKIILRLDGFLISARKRIEQYQIYIICRYFVQLKCPAASTCTIIFVWILEKKSVRAQRALKLLVKFRSLRDFRVPRDGRARNGASPEVDITFTSKPPKL